MQEDSGLRWRRLPWYQKGCLWVPLLAFHICVGLYFAPNCGYFEDYFLTPSASPTVLFSPVLSGLFVFFPLIFVGKSDQDRVVGANPGLDSDLDDANPGLDDADPGLDDEDLEEIWLGK